MLTEQAGLSLSKINPPSEAGTMVAASGSEGGSIPTPADAIDETTGLRRLSIAAMNHSLRRILLAAPAYPSGIGGRLYSSGPPGAAPSSREHKAGQVYRLIFDRGASDPVTGAEAGAVETTRGLEATRDDANGALTVRELVLSSDVGGKNGGDESGNRSCGDVVARIEASIQVSGGRKADYGVVLAGCGNEGEVMSIRVETHTTKIEAPRETRAVFLLPQQGPGRDSDWIPAWDSSRTANPSGGLWEAVASGRMGDESVVKLRNKRAVRSSVMGAFELDLLEAWRPGRIGVGPQQNPSSQSAPETVQMVVAVSRRDGGIASARSAGSSSSSAREDNRLPVMQLVRVKGNQPDAGDDLVSDLSGSFEGDVGGSGGGCDFHWRVALTAPMPTLYGFCLAVVGLETGVVGASVTMVDRAAEESQAEAAAGFLGFEKALVVEQGGDISTTLKLDLRSSPNTSVLPPRSSRGDALFSVGPSKRDVYLANDTVESTGSTGGIDAKHREGRDGTENPVPEIGPGVAETAFHCGRQNEKANAPAFTDGVQAEASAGRGADDATTSRTVPIPVKRKMSVKVAAAKIVDKVYRNTYVCNICLSALMVSFAADLYPGAPSYNAALSAALLWASCNVDTVRALRRRSFVYALSIVVLVSLFVDLDFLASATRLEEEDDDLQRVVVGKHMLAFARITVGLAAALKALSWQGLLATCPQGVHALNLLWRRFKLFLPIWGSPRKLTKEVYNRIVALAWVHLLGAMALVTLAGVTALGFGWAPQFASAQGAGAPLTAICFLKSTTNLLTSAALFRNIDLALCLNVFGCLACFQDWHRAREERRRTRHGVTYPKVVLEWDYIMLCSYIKIFDLLVGLWVWIGLGWSWSEDLDYSGRHSIRMLLIAITTIQTLTDIWSVFLGITVSLLVSQYLLRKERMAKATRQAFGDGADGDVEIARSLTTGRLLSPLPLSPEASSVVGKSAIEDGLESDEDSYSTGESETRDNTSDDRVDDVSRQTADQRRKASGIDAQFQTPSPVAFVQARAIANGDTATVHSQSATGESRLAAPSEPVPVPAPVPRRRSMFAPGGNRLVYKRAFSARSSSDDTVAGGGNDATPIPEAVILDRDLTITVEEFNSVWDSLDTCANFRCRIGRLPEIEAVASHLREQGFFVVASGAVPGKNNTYACARGVGLEAIFFVELAFEKEMHELEFTFKCHDERLKALFACHMNLRRIIGDHQPIA